MTEDEKKGSFKVTDRRIFTEDGEVREDRNQEREGRIGREETPKIDPAPSPGREQAAPGNRGEIELSSFILSLATTAMVHLGEITDPKGKREPVNLDAAKQMVDILNMIQKKTQGNRTDEETRLLEEVLYQLRMKILEKTKAIKL